MIFEEVLKLFYIISWQVNLVQFTQTYFMKNKTKQAFLDIISFLMYTENAAC